MRARAEGAETPATGGGEDGKPAEAPAAKPAADGGKAKEKQTAK